MFLAGFSGKSTKTTDRNDNLPTPVSESDVSEGRFVLMCLFIHPVISGRQMWGNQQAPLQLLGPAGSGFTKIKPDILTKEMA